MSERIREGAKVVASDGEEIGVVEALDGDRIRLVRAVDGQPRLLPLSCVEDIDAEGVRLQVSGAGAERQAARPVP